MQVLLISFQMNEMKIKDEKSEKEVEAAAADGNRTETGHIIVITIGGRKGQPKQVFEINCWLKWL